MFDRAARRSSADAGKRRKRSAGAHAAAELQIGGPGPGAHDVGRASLALRKQGSLAARPSTAPFSSGAGRSLGGPSVTALGPAHARESVQSARAASRPPPPAQYLSHSETMAAGRGAPPFGTAPRFGSTAAELAAALEPGPGAFSPLTLESHVTHQGGSGGARPTFSRAGRMTASDAPGDASTGPAALALLLSAKRRNVPSIPAPHEAGFEEGPHGALRAVFMVGGREIAAPEPLVAAAAAAYGRSMHVRDAEAEASAAAAAESQLAAFAAAAASVPGPGSYEVMGGPTPGATFSAFGQRPGTGTGMGIGMGTGSGARGSAGVTTAPRITPFDASLARSLGPGPANYSPILPQEVPGPSARLASAAFASGSRRGIEAVIGRPGTSSQVGPGSFDVAAASAALARGRRWPAASNAASHLGSSAAAPPPFLSTATRLAPLQTAAVAKELEQRARRPHSAPSIPAAHAVPSGAAATSSAPGASSHASHAWPAVGSYDVRQSSTDAIAARAREQAARLAWLAPAREARASASAAQRSRSAGAAARATRPTDDTALPLPVPAFASTAARFAAPAAGDSVSASALNAQAAKLGADEAAAVSHGRPFTAPAADKAALRRSLAASSPCAAGTVKAVKHHLLISRAGPGAGALPHVGPGAYAVDPVLGPSALAAAGRPSAAFVSSVPRAGGGKSKPALPALTGDSISRMGSSDCVVSGSHERSHYSHGHEQARGARGSRYDSTPLPQSPSSGRLQKGRASLGAAQPPAPFSGSAFKGGPSRQRHNDFDSDGQGMHAALPDPLSGGASIVHYTVGADGARLPRGSSRFGSPALGGGDSYWAADGGLGDHGAGAGFSSGSGGGSLLKRTFSASAQRGRFDAVTAAAAPRSFATGLGHAADSDSPGPGAYELRQPLPVLHTLVPAAAAGVAPWAYNESGSGTLPASAQASASASSAGAPTALSLSLSAAIFVPLRRTHADEPPAATAAFGSAPRFAGLGTAAAAGAGPGDVLPPGPAAYRPEAATGFRSRRTFNVALAANEIRRALRS